MKLSAIVIAKNEEKNIPRCLTSLTFADEVVVVDNTSTDTTGHMARAMKAKVITSSIKNNFSALRTVGMNYAKGEWLLYIDADEEVTNELQKSILKAISENKKQVFYIKRRDNWWGRQLTHGEVSTAYHQGIIRLVKRGSGSWKHLVHEAFNSKFNAETLNGYLDHYPHPTVASFIESINRYSSIRAKELHDNGVRATIFTILIYPFGKFIYTYLIKGGFLDGAAGFVYSFMMSFHSFLVRSKLYTMKP
ncbi:MAG: glycosyltransferase family 2 protein [bacterium]|nr:glycosyltransferase family 2 protein [bacterium]